MKYEHILATFETILESDPDSLPIVWQDGKSQQINPPIWFCALVPTGNQALGLNNDGKIKFGYLDIKLVAPKGQVAIPGFKFYSQIEDLFPMGILPSVYEGSISIRQPPLLIAAFENDSYWHQPIHVQFEAY